MFISVDDFGNQQLCCYSITDLSYLYQTQSLYFSQQSVKIALKRNETEFTKTWNGKLIFLKREIIGPTRYGVDETFSNVSPFRVYWNTRFFYFSLETLRTEHFEGLKHIPHRSAQSCNAYRSLCSLSWSARHFIGRYRRQSSAKRRTCDETV